MKIYTGIAQGSAAWLSLRCGLPSASNFSKIVTPVKGELSDSRFPYMAQLLTERMLNGSLADTFESGDMARGSALEGEAREWYSFETGRDLEQVCFVGCEYEIPLTGTVRYGCSPDAFADARQRTVEIKSPMPAKHGEYLMASKNWKGSKLEISYRPQVQGQMLACQTAEADIVSYHPSLPKVILTVPRDEKYVGAMQLALEQFCIELEQRWEKYCREWGPFAWTPFQLPLEPTASAQTNDFIGDADLEAILGARRS